jgi:hypothetical protein
LNLLQVKDLAMKPQPMAVAFAGPLNGRCRVYGPQAGPENGFGIRFQAGDACRARLWSLVPF